MQSPDAGQQQSIGASIGAPVVPRRPDIISQQLGGVANLSLMAQIKPGFVTGFETVTYVKRLSLLLKALNAARQVTRESAMSPSPFPDAVGRLKIIQSFRYNIFPPEPEQRGLPDAFEPLTSAGKQWLLLNVVFDGGWEPYMRVIYRDIGLLLDTILCNCIGYTGSRKIDFDSYVRWVRAHEVPHGLFYTESSMSTEDQRYFTRTAEIQLAEADPAHADVRIAGFALEPLEVAAQAALQASPGDAVQLGLRSLKSLYGLARIYPPNDENEHLILIGFAQLVLKEFHALAQKLDLVSDLRFAAYRAELGWLDTPCPPPFDDWRTPPLAFDPAKVQGGILKSYPGITHGALVLLQVVDADKAGAWLEGLAASIATAAGGDAPGLRCNVALSFAGLRALGATPARLADFPQEFAEGMESRAGLLGDVRANHPDQWRRPTRNWREGKLHPDGMRIELSSVHVVLQYRLDGGAELSRDALHPLIGAQIEALEKTQGAAVCVLSVQLMHRYPDAKDVSAGHFGFADGISQPSAVDPPAAGPDEVLRGEILLGHPNPRRGGTLPPKPDALLDNGSFLVVRKLRQRLDVLREVTDRAVADLVERHPDAPTSAAEVQARMMGRWQDGRPLVTAPAASLNGFDYAGDPQGMQCPFQSHARRANPRNSHTETPRIVRQGMSYGPRHDEERDIGEDRGLVFMAYVGSIAEQFEILQRWMAGGNSSGLHSGLSDPFLGMPGPGESRTFRYLDGQRGVVRIDLGSRPIVELQWGAYLFAPSLTALRQLRSLLKAKPALTPIASLDDTGLETWRGLLEDPGRRVAAWQAVRAQPGGKFDTDYGELVGSSAEVAAIFKDDGSRHSVCGYGHRFEKSIGLGFLGVDPVPPNPLERDHTDAVNQAIERITAAHAFVATVQIANGLMTKFAAQRTRKPDGQWEALVDLVLYSEQVLARLCALWFGLPGLPELPGPKFMAVGGRGGDNASDALSQCPGSFISVSRYVFSPRPSPTVVSDAQEEGKLIRANVAAYLAATPDARLTPLMRDIKNAVLANPAVAALPPEDQKAAVARTAAGVMLGFPPTVGGNFYRVLAQDWVPHRTLWDLQARLPVAPAGTLPAYDAIENAIRPALIAAMRKQPTPDMVWRQPPQAEPPSSETFLDTPAKPVVVGIIGAMLDPDADPMLMFGGHRSGADRGTHACPGYGMAMGVLIGMVYALLTAPAEALRPTPSDTVLSLINPA